MTNNDAQPLSNEERSWLNRYPASLQHAAAAAFGVPLHLLRPPAEARKRALD